MIIVFTGEFYQRDGWTTAPAALLLWLLGHTPAPASQPN